MKRSEFTEDQMLRDVDLDGYRLTTWDTYRTTRHGKSELYYELVSPLGETIFWGSFYPGVATAIDSDDTLCSIMVFATVPLGGTDPDYFDGYSPRQMEFSENEAEPLYDWSLRPDMCWECRGVGCSDCGGSGLATHDRRRTYYRAGVPCDPSYQDWRNGEITIFPEWEEK